MMWTAPRTAKRENASKRNELIMIDFAARDFALLMEADRREAMKKKKK